MNEQVTPGRIPRDLHDEGPFSPLGLYFYFHNAKRKRFVQFMGKYETDFLRMTDKHSLPHPVSRAALTSAAMGRDVLELWRAYGYSIHDSDYERARLLSRGYLGRR